MDDWLFGLGYILRTITPNIRYLGSITSIFSIIVMWFIYNKAFEPGWAAIIPFYNTYVYYKITWGSGWMFLFLLFPILNIVVAIITKVKLAKAFGKSGWFAVGLIFLGIIFNSILAFNEATYQGVPDKS